MFSTVAYAQYSQEIDEDPYLDPLAANEMLQPVKRAKSNWALMFGMGYGLNPIIILAPSLSISLFWDPLVLGLEISDSETLGIWEKERKANFGTSQLTGGTAFIRWFFKENFYLVAASENRSINLWSRTYNRILSGQAKFDMYIKTNIASLGAGLLRFNDLGYLSIDIIRFNFIMNPTVKIVEHWETWSESGQRNKLDQNITERSEKWIKIINAHTGFVVTFGLYF